MPSLKAIGPDNCGLEQAKRLVNSILNQITNGDAPPGNFEINESFNNATLGSGSNSGSGTEGGGTTKRGVSLPTPSRLAVRRASSITTNNSNSNDVCSDAASTTASEPSVSSSVVSTPVTLSRFPPRPPSSSKKNVNDGSGSLSLNLSSSSYNIGASLMGTLSLADLCSRTVESVGNNIGDDGHGGQLFSSLGDRSLTSSPLKKFLSNVLPPPPLSPLESEDSSPRQEENRTLSLGEEPERSTQQIMRNVLGDEDPTPRRHNGYGERVASSAFNLKNQHGVEMHVEETRNNGNGNYPDLTDFAVASKSWNEDSVSHKSCFSFEDVGSPTPLIQSASSEGSWKGNSVSEGDVEKSESSTPLYTRSASSVSGQWSAPSEKDSNGSDTGARRIQMFGSEYARLLSSSSPLSSSSRPEPNPGKIKRSTNIMSSKLKARFSSSIPTTHGISGTSTGGQSSGKESVESSGSAILSLDDCSHSIATAAITDVIVTSGSDAPPRGYYRAFQIGEDSNDLSSLSSVVSMPMNIVPGGRKRQRLFINVKKEPSWDRAVQRPCVTALCIIFPDRNEFVPPGFSVVRHFQPFGSNAGQKKIPPIPSITSRSKHGDNDVGPSASTSTPANINITNSGERVYLCYRRSREGNPITGVMCLRPTKGDIVPEGYTVLERTPRNFLADMSAKTEQPTFLAYRQRLENLECLRPMPLVLSVLQSRSGEISPGSKYVGRKELKAYYCTGGTIVVSDVGRYHIMDRSTHSLLSSSSAQSRLSLIQSSRKESSDAIPSWVSSSSTKSSLTQRRAIYNARTGASYESPIPNEESSLSSGMHPDPDMISASSSDSVFSRSPSHLSLASCSTSATSRSSMSPSIGRNTSPRFNSLFSHSDETLQACFDALAHIPSIECAKSVPQSVYPQSFLQSRVTVITPILTSCYTSQGGSSLLAVEGLTTLLNSTSFFVPDISRGDGNIDGIVESSMRLTLLDLTIQVVCDVATSSARETYFRSCVDFVSDAVRFADGKLNDRTIGFVLRFYLFVFYFGASIPSTGWPFNSEYYVSNTAIMEDFLLSDTLGRQFGEHESLNGVYFPGGAPQAASFALKEFVTIMLAGVGNGLQNAESETEQTNQVDESSSPETYARMILSHLVENAMKRVDVANYTQLALYQIHRSGGSELFWHDMINSCGVGLFCQESSLSQSVIHANIISFAILASFVKISSGKVRVVSQTLEPVPRDVASKLLSMDLLWHFVKTWTVSVGATGQMRETAESSSVIPFEIQNYNDVESVATMVYVIRRLVVPTLLSNTAAALEDCRVYRRVIRIISLLWCNPYYRRRMRIDLAVLIEHFVLKLLYLGPQVDSTFGDKHNEQQSSRSDMPYLFHQQLDVLEEISSWFSSNPKEMIEFFVNYDVDMHDIRRQQNETLPLDYAKIAYKLCESLCTLAEQCGAVITKGCYNSSIKPGNFSPKRKSDVNQQENAVATTAYVSESAELLRTKSLKVISLIAKSLMDCASLCRKNRQKPSALAISNSYSSDRDDFGVSPQLSPVRGFSGDSNIVDYWRKSIERRKAPLYQTNHCEQEKFFGDDSPSSLSLKHSRSEDSSKYALSQHKQEALDIAFDLISTKGLKKGLDYLIACNLLTPSPRDVASFLRVHKSSIDPEILGEYLGEGGLDGPDKAYWNLIRFNYSRAISFVGMNIEQGLRHFLTGCGFRLPGEAQKIDRIISTFSQCYWEDNAGDLQKCPFQDQDTVFVISFAIIMLNTDLHKTQTSKGKAPKKMTRNEFISNLRGVYSSVDKCRDYLFDVYDSIESHPIAISNFLQPSHSGDGEEKLSPSHLKEEDDFATVIQSWIKNVKPAQELLRTLAIRHDNFSFLDSEPDDTHLRDLLCQIFSSIWHHFHGIINASVDNANLDVAGLDSCIDLLEYSLLTASYLDMGMERCAFSKQLERVKRFNGIESTLEGVCREESGEENEKKMGAEENLERENLDYLRTLTKKLNDSSLDANDTKTKAMKLIACRIRNGEILLRDPSRTFVREGDMVKRHQLAGRSSTYRFFLFSDVLVYAHKSSQGDYKVHEELPLHLMKVEEVENGPSSSKTRSFYIHHPNKSFIVVASNEFEKQQWIKDIRSCITNEIRRKVRM